MVDIVRICVIRDIPFPNNNLVALNLHLFDLLNLFIYGQFRIRPNVYDLIEFELLFSVFCLRPFCVQHYCIKSSCIQTPYVQTSLLNLNIFNLKEFKRFVLELDTFNLLTLPLDLYRSF